MTFSDCQDSIEEILTCDDRTDEKKTRLTMDETVGLEKKHWWYGAQDNIRRLELRQHGYGKR